MKKNNLDKRKNLLLSLLIPIIMHGIYDYCLFAQSYLFLIIFVIFIIIVYVLSIKKVKAVSITNRKFKFKDKFCPNCGRKIDSSFCPECGRKNE